MPGQPESQKVRLPWERILQYNRSEPYFPGGTFRKEIDKAPSLERPAAASGNDKEEMIAWGNGYND